MIAARRRGTAGIVAGGLLLASLGVIAVDRALNFAPAEPDVLAPIRPIAAPAPAVDPIVHVPTTHIIGEQSKAERCGGAEQAMSNGPRPATPPQTWIVSEDYPMIDVFHGNQGRTSLDLVIDAAGGVIGCGVSNSSGHFRLDEKACTTLRRRARFHPATDARHCPVASVYHQGVRWVL